MNAKTELFCLADCCALIAERAKQNGNRALMMENVRKYKAIMDMLEAFGWKEEFKEEFEGLEVE